MGPEMHHFNTTASSPDNATPLRVLCISFWTPPEVRPQAILLGKMIPEWVRQGISPILLSVARKKSWDIEIPQYFIPSVSRVCARIPVLRELNEKIFLWYWTQKAVSIIKKHQVDVIFSFANPQECNILGAALRKKTGIPFIAHFSDPWYDNHYKDFSPLQSEQVLKAERYIVEAADRVLFTNQPALELVMKKYPSDWKKKSAVIPHCFDTRDFPQRATPIRTAPPYRISHIGVFYQLRTPEPFFRALSKLMERRPDLRGTFELELIGAANPYAGYGIEQIKTLLATYELKGMTQIVPPVSYRESLRRMVESDLLLVIDADIPGSPYLPSKVIDYIGSGTACVGITPMGSPTEQVLVGSGYRSFAYSEIDKLVEFFEEWITGKITADRDEQFIKEFDVRATSAKLIAQFKAVHSQC